ncbi:MAG: ABC transporter ATP-binding protein, partial [Betaproteobacteria bacterium]|nr:ABC transporter ATP-binding protein [Betaproteobacteria bacterium]
MGLDAERGAVDPGRESFRRRHSESGSWPRPGPGVFKSFGDTQVLKGVDLDIAAGEFITVLGPSGCGKTTLMRIIAGLERQDGGSVDIDGRRSTRCGRTSAISRWCSSPMRCTPMTVAENLALPLRMRRLSWTQRLPGMGWIHGATRATTRAIEARAHEVAAQLQIEPLLGRKPAQLRAGRNSVVAVGRAMVREPAVFLMDEPLSNLDARLRVHMRTELAELHGRLGATFIYVTHDQVEAMTMSDRMVVMVEGRL